MQTLNSLLTYKYSLIYKYITICGSILKRKDLFGSKSVLHDGCELRNKEYKITPGYCHILQVHLGKSL